MRMTKLSVSLTLAVGMGVAYIAHATVIGMVSCGQSCNANLSSGTSAAGLGVQSLLEAMRNSYLSDHSFEEPESGIVIQICGGEGCGHYMRDPEGEWNRVVLQN